MTFHQQQQGPNAQSHRHALVILLFVLALHFAERLQALARDGHQHHFYLYSHFQLRRPELILAAHVPPGLVVTRGLCS